MATHHRRTTNRVCEVCSAPFYAKPSQIALGKGRFCSKDCQYRSLIVPLVERFWKYVGPPEPNGCILWTGATNVGGYGVLNPKVPNGTNIIATRFAYELLIGPIPPGLFALHVCDTPKCVNVFHLFLGGHEENMKDKISKGRQARGEGSAAAKLTEAQVREIRQTYVPYEVTCIMLAKQYGVSVATIMAIVKGRQWKHVE